MSRLVSLVCILVASLVLAGSAHATAVIPEGGAILDYVSGGVNVYDGKGSATFYGRTFSAAPSGGVQAAERYGISLAGKTATVNAIRTIGMAGFAADIVALHSAWNVGQAIGNELATMMGITPRVLPKADGSGWQMDAGVPPIGTGSPTDVRYFQSKDNQTGFVSDWDTSAELVSQQAIAEHNKYGRACTFKDVVSNNLGIPIYWECTDNAGAGWSIITGNLQTKVEQGPPQNNGCPAVVDFSDPRYSAPAGGAPGSDGKCRTGRYQDVSDAVAAQRIEQYSDQPAAAPDVARHAVEDLGQSLPGWTPFDLSGPASITGTPTTSTTSNPDGTTTTKTVTPTTNITYQGNKITYNTSTVTNNCAGANACSTTTETKPAEESDQCKNNPDTLGCAKFGDPPSDKVESTTKDVQYAAEDLGFGGGCPAPLHITVPSRGWDLQMSYQPVCDTAPLIKPAVLALCALAAAGIVAAAIRGS